MKINASIKRLEPKNPFRIARGEKFFVENVFVALEQNGIIGYGEASPNKYYGECADKVLEKVSGLKEFLAPKDVASIQDIKGIWEQVWQYVQPSRAAQCAIDLALWDLLGKKTGVSASRLLWGKPPGKLVSSCTLGICDPADWKARIDELAGYPIIKIKMDHRGDLSFPRYVRSFTGAVLRVDANCSWGSLDIAEMIRKLTELNVEFIEQPLPPENNDQMTGILKKSPMPIIADESCVVLSDVAVVKGKFTGINIKLVKCGGITPALEMVNSAKNLDLKIMVGCMLESNLLISAGAVVAEKADYVDLDGSWLLKDRVFEGVDFQSGVLSLSGDTGLGVQLLSKGLE